jgi:hypothetical protein
MVYLQKVSLIRSHKSFSGFKKCFLLKIKNKFRKSVKVKEKCTIALSFNWEGHRSLKAPSFEEVKKFRLF